MMKRTAFTVTGDLYAEHIKTKRKYSMNTQHYHETYEMYLQIGGNRYMFCEDVCHDMQRGDMMIVAPFDVHYARQGEGDEYERIVMNFNVSALGCILNEDEIYMLTQRLKPGIIHFDDEQTEMLKQLFMRIKHFQDKDVFLHEKMLYSAVLLFVMSALDCGIVTEIKFENKISTQLTEVIKYINEHYDEEITVDFLADIAHMSKNYFCRKFKHATGATAMEFLDNVRLTKVHRLLLNRELSIEEIAYKTGFASSLNLLRAFKKAYEITPSEFRRKRLK